MKNILIFISGFVCALVISVSAVLLYNARDIEYSREDSTISNVQEAIDDLFLSVFDINNLEYIGSTPFVTNTSSKYTFNEDYNYVLVLSNAVDILPNTDDYARISILNSFNISDIISSDDHVVKTYNRNNVHGETRSNIYIY